MRTRLLIEHPETGDWYYTGPLSAAQRLIARDRFVRVLLRGEGGASVLLCDREPAADATHEEALADAAEWGAGDTHDEAWRYALGAAFGPPDDGYDEAELWTWLQIHADPRPAIAGSVAS